MKKDLLILGVAGAIAWILLRKPGTSETIQKAAYVKPKFTAGKGLKDALN